MHRKMLTLIITSLMSFAPAWSAPPEMQITNGIVSLRVYVPDAATGFYRGTRFDWSGVVAALHYKSHNYYGPWFSKTDPNVRDFIYDGADITAGPCSAITGPVEEFSPALGFDAAKSGGRFIKIGVGVLRKPDDQKYDSFHRYDLVDGGRRSVKKGPDFIQFSQEVHDAASGYGYVYTKTLRLIKGKPEMVIEHTLKNVGARSIQGSTYNHNFLVLDNDPPGPAFTITLPFRASIDEDKNRGLIQVQSDRIAFLKTLSGKERVFTGIEGFGDTPADYKIRIENKKVRAGMVISGDRPLSKMALWSIRSVLAAEPFIDYAVDPGKEASWTIRYEYYTF
jgi:hypothetical protein